MQLMNRTPLAAEANLSDGFYEAERRYLMLTAKATFQFDAAGKVTLDDQAPLPLFSDDVPTPLGLLPRDSFPRADELFEVMLLGKAYAAGAGKTTQRRVALSIGAVSRELNIFGDRIWLDRKRISDPLPFSEMPLHYERAFGGTFDVLLDADSRLRVSDKLNAHGRGFDIETYMVGLGEALRTPSGYPKVADYVRKLPNVEYPDRLIRNWEDAPPPAGWGAVPPDIGLGMKWALDRVAAEQPIEQPEINERVYHRAHPDWLIPLPPPEAQVEMVGVVPFERASFALPRLRPAADILVGQRSFSLPLVPQVLVLLPEELRFYLVYRAVVGIDFKRGEERGVRLRMEPLWGPRDTDDVKRS